MSSVCEDTRARLARHEEAAADRIVLVKDEAGAAGHVRAAAHLGDHRIAIRPMLAAQDATMEE